jgi:hypothetical protein
MRRGCVKRKNDEENKDEEKVLKNNVNISNKKH